MTPPRISSACARTAATVCAFAVVALALCAGCTSPFALQTLGSSVDYKAAKPDDTKNAASASASVVDAKPVESSSSDSPQPDARTVPPTYATQPALLPPPALYSAPPGESGPDPHQLTALIDEVQSLGALDPEAQRALLANLKQCDPKLWPQMVQQFKAALSYRKQMAAIPQGTTKTDASLATATLPTATLTSAVTQLATSTAAADQPPSKAAPPTAKAAVISDTVKTEGSRIRENSARENSAATTAAASITTVDKPAAKPIAPHENATAGPAIAVSDAGQSQLTAAILELENETASGGSTPADIERQIKLRLLYLAAGRRDDAMRPVSGMAPEQQLFWTKEIFGLATYRDAAKEPDAQRRATEATLHLREAAARLGDLASPVVRNLAFCKEVTSFGVYTKFPNYEFAAGDEALLYCELENLKAAATDRGYHTAVKGSYEVLDAHGSRIAEQEFPVSDDFCANTRRDFFILYHIWMPKQIAAGSYTLQLTIEDTQSNKLGQSTVQFKVR